MSDSFYDPYFDTTVDNTSVTGSTTTVTDSGGDDSSGFLSGLSDIFGTIGTTIGSTFRAVNAPTSPTLGVPTGYYRTPTGQIAPLPNQPVNMNLILILGVVVVAVVLMRK